MSNWTVPQIWKDSECWIIGGGPSMPRQFDVPEDLIRTVTSGRQTASAYSPYLAAIHDKHVIGVNNAYLLGDWLDAMFFGDCAWYVMHRNNLAKWPKLKVTCCARFANHVESKHDNIKYLAKDTNHRTGISDNPSLVSWNWNSGAAAISLAAHFGVNRIVLLGFDMSMDGSRSAHWHAPHGQTKGRVAPPPFARHLKGFPTIAEDAKRRGIEILNASPTSAIQEFPKVAIKELL